MSRELKLMRLETPIKILYILVFFLGAIGLIKNNIFFLIIAAISTLAIIGFSRFNIRSKDEKTILTFMIILMVAFQMISGVSVLSKVGGWDAAAINTIARNYVDKGTTDFDPSFWEDDYLLYYKNNIPITLALSYLLRAADFININSTVFVVAVNNLLILIASILTLVVIYSTLGIKASIFSSILMIFLVNISPYSTVFYTDSVGLFFVALIIFFGYRFYASRNKIYLSLLAFSLVFGYLFKPTILIIPISFILVYFFAYNNKKLFIRKNLTTGAIFMSIILISYGAYTISLNMSDGFAKYSQSEIKEKRVTIFHYLGMGSLRGLPPYKECNKGVYCADYADYIREGRVEEVKNVENKNKYSISLFMDSLMTGFPFEYLSFIMGKVERAFSDGSFGVWTEGSNKWTKFAVNSGFLKEIQEYLTFKNLDRFAITKNIWQVVWFTALIFMSFVVLAKDNKVINSLMLSIVGLAAYQAIFESRSRYIFLFLPIFITLASYGFYMISENRRKNEE